MMSVIYSPGADAVPETTLDEWSRHLPSQMLGCQSDLSYGRAKIDALLGLNLPKEVARARREAKQRNVSPRAILDEKATRARFHDWGDLWGDYLDAAAAARGQLTLFGMFCRYPHVADWQVRVLAKQLCKSLSSVCATPEAYRSAFVSHPAEEFIPCGDQQCGWHLLSHTSDGTLHDCGCPPAPATRIAFIGSVDGDGGEWVQQGAEGRQVRYLATPDPEQLVPAYFEPGPVSIRRCREAIYTALEREAAFIKEGRYKDLAEPEYRKDPIESLVLERIP